MLNSHSPTLEEYEQVWKDFYVHNDDELKDKLILDNDWNIVSCKRCGSKVNVVTSPYTDEGNPICPNCGHIC